MVPKLSTHFIDPGLWALKAFNDSLEEESSPSNLNEDFLESKLSDLTKSNRIALRSTRSTG